MNRTTIAVCALSLGVMMVGCQKKPSTGAPAPPDTSASNTPETTPPPTQPDLPGVPQTTEPQEKRFIIPGKGDKEWKAPQQTALTVEKAAAKVDAALAELTRAYCEFDLATQGELTGQVRGRIMVRRAGDVFAEFRDPVNPADGNHVLTLSGKKYWFGPTGSPQEKLPTLSNDLSKSWLREMPKAIALGLTGYTQGFTQAVRDFRRAGFKVEIESTTMDVGGKKTPFHRILATRPGESEPFTEIRLDGNRWMPLTLRVVGIGGDGNRLLAQWSGRWSFNRPIDETVFVAPQVP